MILIDIYKKLDSTIISKKLGVGICNLDSDGIEEVYNGSLVKTEI